MSYLLDTHAFLWFIGGSNELPEKVIAKIENINEPCFISIASFWEIAIKVQIGKLDISIDFGELFRLAEENQIEILDINEHHLLQLLATELHHNDPFDRIIIAQAISEKLTLVSRDKKWEAIK